MNDSIGKQGLVSVIVPVYKVEPYIQECVRSIVAQSYANIEIILIDDAGSDRSIELAKAVLQKSNRNWIVVTHEQNQGVSVARNSGISIARGEYLYFLDSDDYLAPFCIEKFIEIAGCYAADMVFANHWDIVDGVIVPSTRIASEDTYSNNPVMSHVHGKTTSMAGNRFIRREFYLRSNIAFKKGLRYEDEMWSFSLILRAKKIAFLSDHTYYYRRWAGSFTRNKNNEIYGINCGYINLKHHFSESEKFELFGNLQLRLWLVRKTIDFLIRVSRSNLDTWQKKEYYENLFNDSSVLQPEFDKYTLNLFSLFRKLPFSNRLHYGVKFISLLRSLKNILRRK